MQQSDDVASIDAVAAAFFAAFGNRHGPARVAQLYELMLPQAVVVKNTPAGLEVCDLAQFLAPRQALLSGGRLVDFEEFEQAQRTDISGGIAQRWCRYAKRGVLDGVPFEGQGTKSLQFVKTVEGWRISAVAWEDEP